MAIPTRTNLYQCCKDGTSLYRLSVYSTSPYYLSYACTNLYHTARWYNFVLVVSVLQQPIPVLICLYQPAPAFPGMVPLRTSSVSTATAHTSSHLPVPTYTSIFKMVPLHTSGLCTAPAHTSSHLPVSTFTSVARKVPLRTSCLFTATANTSPYMSVPACTNLYQHFQGGVLSMQCTANEFTTHGKDHQ
jgi:hypothetical protein